MLAHLSLLYSDSLPTYFLTVWSPVHSIAHHCHPIHRSVLPFPFVQVQNDSGFIPQLECQLCNNAYHISFLAWLWKLWRSSIHFVDSGCKLYPTAMPSMIVAKKMLQSKVASRGNWTSTQQICALKMRLLATSISGPQNPLGGDIIPATGNSSVGALLWSNCLGCSWD